MIDTKVDVKEVSRILLHNQDKQSVVGMEWYKNNIYVVRRRGLTLDRYSSDGTFLDKYEDKARSTTDTLGMCLMMDGDTAMLVVSDFTGKALIWITINDDFTMRYHQTKQLNYQPCGLPGEPVQFHLWPGIGQGS